MSKVSAQRSHVYLGGAALGNALFVTEHTTNWNARLAETTVSGGSTGTRYKKVVPDPQWSFSLPFDDAQFVEALGIEEGQELADVYFRHGTSNVADRLQFTTVETVQKVKNANQDVVRIMVSGKGGDVTKNVVVGVEAAS